MRFFFLFLFFAQSFYAENTNLNSYLNYLETYPQTLGPNGSYEKGEIEIIRDQSRIGEIEKLTQRNVGIIAEDKYWIWFNDAVRFPNGTYGVYSRVLWKQALKNLAGVAVLPVLPGGKIALNRNFRHATRSWEYELPRGGLMEGESPEEGALRETQEETGLLVDHLEFLGYINPDSGMTGSVVPVYLAKITEKTLATPEDSEAIAGIDTFTVNELKQGFLKGYLIKEIANEQIKINLRDPFLSFALFQWEIRNIVD